MPSKIMDAWTERLAVAAISETDRRAIAASESARSLTLERIGDDHDMLHAWAALARVLADAGASPSLIAGVVDALASVMSEGDGSRRDWVPLARAALVEAFASAIREAADQRVADAWRFPRCVVRLDDTTAAVTAHFPDDDPDAIAKWADEVAAGLAKMGIRRVTAEGGGRARTALADALAIAGIDLRARPL